MTPFRGLPDWLRHHWQVTSRVTVAGSHHPRVASVGTVLEFPEACRQELLFRNRTAVSRQAGEFFAERTLFFAPFGNSEVPKGFAKNGDTISLHQTC